MSAAALRRRHRGRASTSPERRRLAHKPGETRGHATPRLRRMRFAAPEFWISALTTETVGTMMPQGLSAVGCGGSGAYPGAKQPATGETDEIPETQPETEQQSRICGHG